MSGLALAALVMLVLASAARADHSVIEHVSQGVTGGNGAFSTSLAAASTDGSTVLLETAEQLVAADTDSQTDYYRRAGGVTQLATAGPASTGPNSANLTGMTSDGAAVFFYTRDALVASDTDSVEDAYMYRAGATTLLSPGPTACISSQSFPFGWSDDGSRVFIQSQDRLTAADTDCNSDLYEYNAGTLTLVQPGPASISFFGVSGDGGKVFFVTETSLLPGDTDASLDIYMREGATLTLVSTGPAGGNGAFNALADRVSCRRPRRFPYRRAIGGRGHGLRARHVSLGRGRHHARIHRPGGRQRRDGGDSARSLLRLLSPVLQHNRAARRGRHRCPVDIYDHSGGTTTLVSTGPAGGNGAFAPNFLQHGVSADGSRVLFMTREKLVASDNNGLFDIYERSGGTTTLPLVDWSGASVPSANLQGISADGSRIFFGTTQSLVPADTDSTVDLYERTGSVTTLVSLGPNGGNGAVHVVTTCCPPGTVSADGSRVFFYTSESLVNSDSDASQDVYSASVGPPAGYPRPKGATPLRVSLVPAFRPATRRTARTARPLRSAPAVRPLRSPRA